MFSRPVDLLVVGAGPVGCVVAERAATQMGWSVVLIDRRNHLAGNCYDAPHKSGVLIHHYGPHYFRTNDRALLNYLSSFTEWIDGRYFVQSMVKGRLYPFPINLVTLEQFFGRSFTPEEAEQFLQTRRAAIESPRNSEEFVLSRVGRELYEAFYLGYTVKQWSMHPSQLAPQVCGRIPVRFNRDCRYVDHRFQVMPKRGFTEMFRKMVSHPRFDLRLKTSYRDVRDVLKPRFGTVYCGPIDEYFDYRFGKLQWRSLRFEFEGHDRQFVQPCVQINYPDDFDYTRSVEIKHVTGQKINRTVVSYEFSQATGDPFYPVPCSDSSRLYAQYAGLAAEETRLRRVYFSGRLASYRYINTDEAITIGLETFAEIKRTAMAA